MRAGCRAIWSLLIGLFRSRATLEAENLVLRQQILVLRRAAPMRLSFNALDRLILVVLYRLFPHVRSALAVVRPETVVRWHRAGFSQRIALAGVQQHVMQVDAVNDDVGMFEAAAE